LAAGVAAAQAPEVKPEASALPAPTAPAASSDQLQTWNWHMQNTITGEGYPSFSAKYSGPNSLPAAAQARETVSLDFFAGRRLWRGAEFHLDMLTWQGFGLDGTLGIEAFPNAEAYKIGIRYPHEDIARFFIRQTIGLGGEKEAVPSDQLTLAGNQPASRLIFTVGRYSSKDIFDNNAYANDPRTQFMNWAFVANAIWDYPADSLGYTTGISIELLDSSSCRVNAMALPPRASTSCGQGTAPRATAGSSTTGGWWPKASADTKSAAIREPSAPWHISIRANSAATRPLSRFRARISPGLSPTVVRSASASTRNRRSQRTSACFLAWDGTTAITKHGCIPTPIIPDRSA
jgi:hypothetical protein